MVIPWSNPFSFSAICPWSWYMVTTPSKSPLNALINNISEGNGPLASIPISLAFSITGPITSISSRPHLPPSPQCGLRAARASLGFSIPEFFRDTLARRTALMMVSSVRFRLTWLIGIWLVVRVVHRSPRTLISPKGSVWLNRWAM